MELELPQWKSCMRLDGGKAQTGDAMSQIGQNKMSILRR